VHRALRGHAAADAIDVGMTEKGFNHRSRLTLHLDHCVTDAVSLPQKF
jgi:hypothetical protein